LASFSFQVPRLVFAAKHVVTTTRNVRSVNTRVLAFMLPPGCGMVRLYRIFLERDGYP
jgi:hypothetical protein